MYPGHSLVISNDNRISSILDLPGIVIHALDRREAQSEQVSNVTLTLGKRSAGELAGSLDDNVIFGSYKLSWKVRASVSFISHC